MPRCRTPPVSTVCVSGWVVAATPHAVRRPVIIENGERRTVRTACVSGRSEGGFTIEATEITERIAEHRVAATPRVSTVCVSGRVVAERLLSVPPATERGRPRPPLVRTACVSGRSEGGFTTEATEITERIAEHRVAATPRVSTVCDGTRTPSSAASEPPSTERRTPSAICATHADR